MEAIEIASRIQQINTSLGKAQKELENTVKSKKFAKASAAYDGAIEQSIHQLQHGLLERYGKIPVTLAKDMAKGLCKDRLAEKIEAELEIKVLFSRINVLEAMLTGWQSVYKFLDKVQE